MIAVPQDMSVLAEPLAPDALVLADLLTLPGRGDAEAEQLMDMLARTSEYWRVQWLSPQNMWPRAARLTPHDKQTARIARGLEPALVDNSLVLITSFEPDDNRAFQLRTAGPAALLTAKAIKIGERLQQSDRQRDRLKQKDALDALRILQAIEVEDLVSGFSIHKRDEHAWSASIEAFAIYREHASSADGRIPRLAAAATQGDRAIAPAFAALIFELLDAIRVQEVAGPHERMRWRE